MAKGPQFILVWFIMCVDFFWFFLDLDLYDLDSTISEHRAGGMY